MSFGTLVDPVAVEQLKKLNQNETEVIIKKIKEQKPLMITPQLINQFLLPEIIIIKKFIQRDIHSIGDWIAALNDRYSTLQNILMKKLDPKTLSSINSANGHVTIIGMVKEIQQKNNSIEFEIEDSTGSLKVFSDLTSEKILQDDVIAVTGDVANKIMRATEIIWPDIQHTSAQTNIDASVCFVSNQDLSEKIPENLKSADYVIMWRCAGLERLVAELPNIRTAQITDQLNPCILSIGGCTIFVWFDSSDPQEILKRRYLVAGGTDFLIDRQPDIFFTDAREPSNYKDVLILSNGKINLRTKEIIHF